MKPNYNFKNSLALFSWIAGLLLIISLLWILTQGAQARNLLRAVNNVFISNDDQMRVSSVVQKKAGGARLMGYWYSIYNSNDLLFVFTVFQDGILIPFGAVVSQDNKVKEIFPLSVHAKEVYNKIPQSMLQIYINRIETQGKK